MRVYRTNDTGLLSVYGQGGRDSAVLKHSGPSCVTDLVDRATTAGVRRIDRLSPKRGLLPDAGLDSLHDPNWSGAQASVTDQTSDYFTSIHTTWTVPRLSAPSLAPRTKTLLPLYTWVGIGGSWLGGPRIHRTLWQVGTWQAFNGHATATELETGKGPPDAAIFFQVVDQIGHTVKSNKVTKDAWNQQEGHGGTDGSIALPEMPVASGDLIEVQMSRSFHNVSGRWSGLFNVVNWTQLAQVTFEFSCGTPFIGNFAAWILEQPGNVPGQGGVAYGAKGSNLQVPLPNFGAVYFDDAYATCVSGGGKQVTMSAGSPFPMVATSQLKYLDNWYKLDGTVIGSEVRPQVISPTGDMVRLAYATGSR
jgi:Peptidase A4 family